MKRRQFLRMTFGAVFAAPLIWVAERMAPARYVEAIRAWRYPGAVKLLDPDSVSRPGRWAG